MIDSRVEGLIEELFADAVAVGDFDKAERFAALVLGAAPKERGQ